MKFIHEGWAIIAEQETILFHDSSGKKNAFYSYKENIHKISATQYFQLKYGQAFEKILKIYGDAITDTSYDLKGNLYVSFYQDGLIRKFNVNGNLINEFEDNFDTVYDIDIEGNSIWLAYPTANTIKRYALDDFAEEISLGDRSNGTTFLLPESIVIYDGYLYVCDMGNHRIQKVNLSNLRIDNYRIFGEPVWEYVRTKNNEYVRLQSGIYLL